MFGKCAGAFLAIGFENPVNLTAGQTVQVSFRVPTIFQYGGDWFELVIVLRRESSFNATVDVVNNAVNTANKLNYIIK